MFHLPSFTVINTEGAVTNLKAGYGLKEASSLEQVKKTDIPILYMHGATDTFVPISFTHALYENTNSESEMVTFSGASHGEGIVLERKKYLNHLNKFLDRYVGLDE